jgi:hypothetical protein
MAPADGGVKDWDVTGHRPSDPVDVVGGQVKILVTGE